MTGIVGAGLGGFDDLMSGYIRKTGAPGGGLAIVRGGRLLQARGYGYADRDAQTPWQPTSLCRIGSLSKSITAVAVMTLVQSGRVRLDERVFSRLDVKPYVKPGTVVDPRLWTITVRQLLQHTGGWDTSKSGDFVWSTWDKAKDLGLPMPINAEAVVRHGMGRPLDFNPGTRFAYCNFGYLVLGRLVEKASGQSYEEYVKKNVLARMGITRMCVAKSRPADRRANEVHYYDVHTKPLCHSVFPEDGDKLVPKSYGGAYYEAADSYGGWLASPVDLARFIAELQTARARVLTPDSYREMAAPPPPPVGKSGDAIQYGFGLNFQRRGDELCFFHGGNVNGASTYLASRFDGAAWAFMFNTNNEGESLANDLAQQVMGLAEKVATGPGWPSQDLFGNFKAT